MPNFHFVVNYPYEILENAVLIQAMHVTIASACKDMVYFIGCIELNENKNPHSQCYCSTKKHYLRKDLQAKLINKVQPIYPLLKEYIEVKTANGTAKENYDYITHTGVHKDKGPLLWDLIQYGDITKVKEKAQGDRTDLKNFAKAIVQDGLQKAVMSEDKYQAMVMKYPRGAEKLQSLALQEKREKLGFRRPNVIIFYGVPEAKKSRKAFEAKTSDGRPPYIVPAVTGTTPWFGTYSGQSTIIFNDFRGQISFNYLLEILDGYPIDLPIKCSQVPNLYDTVYITSNHHPRHWYSGLNSTQIGAFVRRISHVEECHPDHGVRLMTWDDLDKKNSL